MDALQETIRRTVLDHIGLQDENERLTAQNRGLTAQNEELHRHLLAAGTTHLKLTGPEGNPVYYTGTRNNFDWTDPVSWEHGGGRMVFVQRVRQFSVLDIPTMELHLSGRVFPLADASNMRAFLSAAGDILYRYYLALVPTVRITVAFHFQVARALVQDLDPDGIAEINIIRVNPANLTLENLRGGPPSLGPNSVSFRYEPFDHNNEENIDRGEDRGEENEGEEDGGEE